MSGVLAVDIGQTGFRLCWEGERAIEVPQGVNALTSPERIQALASQIASHVPASVQPMRIGIGLSGFVDGSAAPHELAASVHSEVRPRETVVAADAVTAYLGTLGPREGTVVICGTGVAALGAGTSGLPRRVDARGYLLGDFGSGFWIGQRGLHAALDAAEGRGPETALSRAAAQLGSPKDIYHAAMSSDPAPKYVASFARAVLEAGESGDAVALQIVHAAAEEIVKTIRATGPARRPVGLTGGLTRSSLFLRAVSQALGAARIGPSELVVRPDAALEGARIVAETSAVRQMFAGLITVVEDPDRWRGNPA